MNNNSEIKSYVEDSMKLRDIVFSEDGSIQISTKLDMKKDIEDAVLNSICRKIHESKDNIYGMTVTNKSDNLIDSIVSQNSNSTMYILFHRKPYYIPPYVYYYGCLVGGKPNKLIDSRDKLKSKESFCRDEFINIVWENVDTTLHTKQELYDFVELPSNLDGYEDTY